MDSIMKRNEVLWKLRDAKKAHRKWVGFAYALIEGVSLEKEQVPVNETDCAFGLWFFGEGQDFNHKEVFSEIGKHHQKLHQVYTEIYVLLFGEQKRSFFQKLVGKKAKVSEETRALARKKYNKLNEISHQLIRKIEELETEIKGSEEASA